MSGEDGGPEGPLPGTPEALQVRIEQLKKPRRHDPGFGQAVGLVFTLGVTVAGILVGSWMLGQRLDEEAGVGFYTPTLLLLGAAGAFWVGYLLLRPLLRTP